VRLLPFEAHHQTSEYATSSAAKGEHYFVWFVYPARSLCNTLPSNRSWVRSCHLQPCPSLPLPPPSSHHPLIIGISGPSGCGKSALARGIKTWSCSRNPAAHIECSVLSMDSFFNRTLCGRFGHWENPEGIRIADFMYGSSPKFPLFYPTQPRAPAPPLTPPPPPL